jgi:hypothetical protein
MKQILLAGACVLMTVGTACSQQKVGAGSGESPANQPPDARHLIGIMLCSAGVARSVDVSCSHAGSLDSDRTLGDYIATLLTEYTQKNGQNWLTASCKAAPGNDTSGAAWHCEVMFHRENGEDSWARGLFFRLTRSEKVIPNSYICTGGN